MSAAAYRSLLEDPDEIAEGTDVFAGAIASPIAVIRQAELDGNIAAMQQWCADQDVELAPHGKTTLTPALFRRQLEAGAWGLTVASPAQARIAIAAGAQRVIIANEVTDPAGIRWLAGVVTDRPEVRVCCYVDSLDGVALLDAILAPHLQDGGRLDVLVELGTAGGRTGLRDDDQAAQVARAVVESPHLRLAGVAGYEGVVGGQADDAGVSAVRDFCERLARFANALATAGDVEADGDRPMIVTAGGSVFFDEVVWALRGVEYVVPSVVVLRSGCYVVHDHGMYQRLTPAARSGEGPSLEGALQVWGRVLSAPEPGRVVVDVGRRDISFDAGLPVVLGCKPRVGGDSRPLAATVVALNDQHAFVDLADGAEVGVGEWVCFGVSHPCTTFDKWSELLVVDAEDRLLTRWETSF